LLERRKFIGELVETIRSAVAAGEAGKTEPEVNALANQIVSVLAERNGTDLIETFQAVEACFTEIVTRDDAPDLVFDGRALGHELRAHVRLLGIALQRQHPDGDREDKVSLSDTDVEILKALQTNGPLSGRQLVGNALVTAREETVARRLQQLRRHGYVDSFRKGKSTINSLTEIGRRAIPAPETPTTWTVGVPRRNGAVAAHPTPGR
jgi:hypothetical protein